MTKYIDQFIAYYDTNGEPLVGGKLNFYEAGTTTRQPVYSDKELTIPLSNPLIADSNGRFATFYMQKLLYKIELTDSNNVVIATEDNIDYTNETLFNDIKQYATTTSSGVVILATASDVIAGTSDTKVVTPASIVDSLNSIEILPKDYINGGVISYNTAKIIDISNCLAKSSNEAEKIDVIGNSLDISVAESWANGSVPSLTDTTIYVWAYYNSGSDRFILDNETGSNITEPKRYVGKFITDSSDNIIPFVKYGYSKDIYTEYDDVIVDLDDVQISSEQQVPISVPNNTKAIINAKMVMGSAGGGTRYLKVSNKTGEIASDINFDVVGYRVDGDQIAIGNSELEKSIIDGNLYVSADNTNIDSTILTIGYKEVR